MQNNIYYRSIQTQERTIKKNAFEIKIASLMINNEFPQMRVFNDIITGNRGKIIANTIYEDMTENIKFTYENELFLQYDSCVNHHE